MTQLKYGSAIATRQDSAFYTDDNGFQLVWQDKENPFAVYREGEMRINAVKDGSDFVIRYTEQLEDFGIKTDDQLAEWSAKGEEVFDWVNNSWFVVLHEEDTEWFSEPLHSLDEAIAYAEMANKNPEEFLS